MTAQDYVLFLKDIDKEDIPTVGGKGANLGEMTKIALPVPNGFAITVKAYNAFMNENQLFPRIYKILDNTNYEKQEEVENASKEIKKLINTHAVPNKIKKEIFNSYRVLSGTFSNSLVAVRTSATAEDMPGTSFAGQGITFLNIKGESNVVEAVKDCWASLFTSRSIYYRYVNKIKHDTVGISAIVQKMIQSEVSGVMFTIDPVTNEKDRIIIEAVWGLGEMIVQGSVIPDKYVVQKETFSILSKEISEQKVQLIKKRGKTTEQKVPKRIIGKQKLSDKEIIALAKVADKLQKHYFYPQDAEWAKEKGKLYLVQTRPVTALKNTKAALSEKTNNTNAQEEQSSLILSGSPASPGIGSGKAVVIKSAAEIGKVTKGDVLIAPMTSPDFVSAMKIASAIVTDEGGQTSHAAIVSRELGIPCVVGTKTATQTIKTGTVISVNGKTGEIFLGALLKSKYEKAPNYTDTDRKTATKIYVNLAEPARAREIAKYPVDGVGLLRAEFIIAGIGIHPKEAIKLKKQEQFVNKLAEGITTFCAAFYPRQVVYRATDFKTNEYRSLQGGKYWEPEESNPMLGFRGAFRYIADPEVFNLELQAIKKVREKYNNLWIMIPFVRSPEELKKVRKMVEVEGLFEEKTFKFWMMVELPVNVILLDEFIKVGIDGVSIGSNDLTMLLLGTDRDNAEVARAFDERSPSVMWALKKIIKTCNEHSVTSSICGQAPSTYDDLVENLIDYGVTSVSINPDAIERVKHVIVEKEKKIIS
jgi:pyruvate, water dikinase